MVASWSDSDDSSDDDDVEEVLTGVSWQLETIRKKKTMRKTR